MRVLPPASQYGRVPHPVATGTLGLTAGAPRKGTRASGALVLPRFFLAALGTPALHCGSSYFRSLAGRSAWLARCAHGRGRRSRASVAFRAFAWPWQQHQQPQNATLQAVSPGLKPGRARIENKTPTGIVLCLRRPGETLWSFDSEELLLVSPDSHLDVEVTGRKATLALRRGKDGRMFSLPAGIILTLTKVASPVDGGVITNAVIIQDLVCSMRPSSQEVHEIGESRQLYAGPLFWRLPNNLRDKQFKVGSTLRAKQGSIILKVVRDQGTDWRGYPMARVRVVEGGLHGGKVFVRGSMYIAKIVMKKRAMQEILESHKRLHGFLGAPSQIVAVEGSWQVDSGAWLLILEDFGETARDFFLHGGKLSAADADRCAADLLAGIAAMHSHGMHHLALSPSTIKIQRDGLGRFRLKLANMGVSEQPSDPLPPGYAPKQSYLAPEIAAPQRFSAIVNAAVDPSRSKSRQRTADEMVKLSDLGSLTLLPSLQRPQKQHRSEDQARQGKEQLIRLKTSELLRKFSAFAKLPSETLERLAADFEGPFQVPEGRQLFKTGDTGDFLYFILAGFVVSNRGGGKELCRYGRGDFFGEAALLGAKPSKRIFNALTPRGSGGCAILRMGHAAFLENMKDMDSPLVGLVAPSRWRFLADAHVPLAEPKAADVFAAGAIWVRLVAPSVGAVQRVRQVTSVEQLRAQVATNDLGNFYFTLQERRIVALITLMLRRASPGEALRCLDEEGEETGGDDDAASSRGGPLGGVQHALDGVGGSIKAAFELGPAAEVASDALLLSARASKGVVETWGRFVNDMTNRRGVLYGEVLGEIYGRLFAKDLRWMFRNPSRTQLFPILLVRDAERGNIIARWTIGSAMVFESELCKRTLPRVLRSIWPAFKAGFEIGAAVGRNRAVNFKTLWIDAFLGSFVKRFAASMRIRMQRVKGSVAPWEDLQKALRVAVQRGQSARRMTLLRKGRLPTTYDQNAPGVLELLPDQWVPDIGLPLASGIGRGFFKKLRLGFRRGRRTRYVRPKFETWDVDDVPQPLLDFAREQGEWQASLVAGSVGDTLARDAGKCIGTAVGYMWGGVGVVLRRGASPSEERRRYEVAGGYLENQQELLELTSYEAEDE